VDGSAPPNALEKGVGYGYNKDTDVLSCGVKVDVGLDGIAGVAEVIICLIRTDG